MDEVRGEPRWPMSLAVVFVIVLIILLPERATSLPKWAFPGLLTILLIALVATDPGKITKTELELRWLSIAMVIVMALAALNATTVLIHDLIVGSPSTKSGSTLLAAGGAVWAINVVAFALLYWEFDSGGAATRAHGMPSTPDFAFPQQLDPEIAPGWRPRFVDYLYVGITDAVAFSPTDAMPLAPWAKLAMALEAMVSFVIIGLVIARAVNVLK